jgi:hypothetical protein
MAVGLVRPSPAVFEVMLVGSHSLAEEKLVASRVKVGSHWSSAASESLCISITLFRNLGHMGFLFGNELSVQCDCLYGRET